MSRGEWDLDEVTDEPRARLHRKLEGLISPSGKPYLRQPAASKQVQFDKSAMPDCDIFGSLKKIAIEAGFSDGKYGQHKITETGSKHWHYHVIEGHDGYKLYATHTNSAQHGYSTYRDETLERQLAHLKQFIDVSSGS